MMGACNQAPSAGRGRQTGIGGKGTMRKLRLCAGVMALVVLMLASTSCGSPAGLVSMAIIPEEVTLRQQGSTVQFIVNGHFQRGPDRDITSEVDWASSLPSVATVNSSGLATAAFDPNCIVANTLITASREGKTVVANVRVTLEGTPLCP